MRNPDESAQAPERSKSRSRRRNERRNRNRPNKGLRERITGPECSICNKPIRDVSSAINDQESENPAHFDCILKKLSESESLEKQEKIVYLGSGNFGIVKITNNKKFEIVKKIQYENTEDIIKWRKEMRFKFPENKKAR